MANTVTALKMYYSYSKNYMGMIKTLTFDDQINIDAGWQCMRVTLPIDNGIYDAAVSYQNIITARIGSIVNMSFRFNIPVTPSESVYVEVPISPLFLDRKFTSDLMYDKRFDSPSASLDMNVPFRPMVSIDVPFVAYDTTMVDPPIVKDVAHVIMQVIGVCGTRGNNPMIEYRLAFKLDDRAKQDNIIVDLVSPGITLFTY